MLFAPGTPSGDRSGVRWCWRLAGLDVGVRANNGKLSSWSTSSCSPRRRACIRLPAAVVGVGVLAGRPGAGEEGGGVSGDFLRISSIGTDCIRLADRPPLPLPLPLESGTSRQISLAERHAARIESSSGDRGVVGRTLAVG